MEFNRLKKSYTEEERSELRQAIIEETEQALGASEYKEFESLYAHLTSKERIEEVIYRAVKKAVEKADDISLGLAARYAKNATEYRQQEKEERRRGRPKKHKTGRQVSIWLEDKQIDIIQKFADHEGSDFSTVAAGIIEAALDEIETDLERIGIKPN